MLPSEQVTISIASKDRPAVVDATLRKIHAFGLGECALILCDDGSSPALNPPALSLFPQGLLIRNERAEGQALARNRIAQECGTPYLLQLDDDSYPVEGSVLELLEFVSREIGWLSVAIPFEEPARNRRFPVGIPKSTPLALRAFVGCAALMHVETFLKLGGYATWIGRTVEEEELCIRAHSEGLRIVSVDLLRIRHDVTGVARNETAIAYRSMRNWTLVWLLYSPLIWLPLRLSRLFLASIVQSAKLRSGIPVKGYFDAFNRFLDPNLHRSPLRRSDYRRYYEAPHALELFSRG